MNRRDLVELVSISEWPCISILAPLERQGADNQQNEIRVKSLIRRAREKVVAERVDEKVARPVLERIESLTRGADLFSSSGLGLAVFASPSYSRRLELPFAVRERVAVDRVFATRDILVALERGARWRAVVLGSERPRILDGYMDRLVDLAVPGPAPFESIDTELAPLMHADPLPLVVVGFEPEIVSFVTDSRFAHEVIVTVRGRHHRTAPRELGAHLWPIVREAIEAKRTERVHRELDAAIKHARLVSGMEDVWAAAHQGRGAVLIVEDGLHFPVAPGAGQRALLRAPAGLEADNAIDEVVDVVLSMGGEVHFVPLGSLPEHQGIALVTRYAAVREVA